MPSKHQSPSPHHKHFVVDPIEGYIRSGWEYSDDAKDMLQNDREDGLRGLKLFTRQGLIRFGLDPDDETCWMPLVQRVRKKSARYAPNHIQQDVADFVFHQVTSSDNPLSAHEASSVVAMVRNALEEAYRRIAEE